MVIYYIVINYYCRIFLILSETFYYECKKNTQKKTPVSKNPKINKVFPRKLLYWEIYGEEIRKQILSKSHWSWPEDTNTVS